MRTGRFSDRRRICDWSAQLVLSLSVTEVPTSPSRVFASAATFCPMLRKPKSRNSAKAASRSIRPGRAAFQSIAIGTCESAGPTRGSSRA